MKKYVLLLGINLFYSLITIVSKKTSYYQTGSLRFFLGYGLVLAMLFVYAILWQQVLKKVALSTAFMFKASSIIFIMLISFIVFRESISLINVIGCVIISIGVLLLFKEK